MIECGLCARVCRKEVGPVNTEAGKAFVSRRQFEGSAAGRLVGDGDGYRVLVVLDQEQYRDASARSPVERLVKISLRRRAVAARGEDVRVVMLPLRGEPEAEPRKPLRTH